MPAAAAATRPLAVTAALIAVLCLAWSSTWWAIRVCLEHQPPLSSAAVRFAIAGAAMALLAPRLRRLENAPAPPTWLWVTTGATNFACSYGVLYIAETRVPSGIAAVLWSIFPLLMASSAVLFLGERLRARQWLGFAVSFAGVAVVLGDSSSGDRSSGEGGAGEGHGGYAWLLLLSPLVSAVGTTLVKRFGHGCSSAVLNRNGMLFGAALLAAAAFWREDPTSLRWTTSVTIATLYLALIGTAMTFGIYFWLLRTAPASQLSLVSYVPPVLAMLLAAAVGDGAPGPQAWLGTAGVVAGIVLVVRRRV
ncbi:MAG: EamA family transporter [Planctomycetes bacterium]|nr:EamA family transporter [Planctomycetota bacterium]